MNNTAQKSQFNPDEHSTDDCIAELSKYGRPHIMQSIDGFWYACVIVSGDSDGAPSESDMKYSRAATAREAINGVHYRLKDALLKMDCSIYAKFNHGILR